MKTVIPGLALAGAALALLGTSARPAAALPAAHPQTALSVSYWRNGHWHPGPRPYFYRRPAVVYRRPAVVYGPARPYFYRHPNYHHPYHRSPSINIHL